MRFLMSVFAAVLFFVLTPGILLSLPPKGSKITVAITHAIVFALVYGLTHQLVYSYLYEGFVEMTDAQKAAKEAADKEAAEKAAADKAAGKLGFRSGR